MKRREAKERRHIIRPCNSNRGGRVFATPQNRFMPQSGSQPLATITVSPETSLRAGRSVRTWHYGPSRGPASLQAFMTLFMMFIMNINILIDISSTVA